MKMIKAKVKFRLFYKNPISDKWNFLYTDCPYCGKKARINKKHIGLNRFGDEFIYCVDCRSNAIIRTTNDIYCPRGHLIRNKTIRLKNKKRYLYCEVCGGQYKVFDCKTRNTIIRKSLY